MFGVGLLLRGYSKTLFSGSLFQSVFPGGDLNAALVPHGFMIGAGLMALIQVSIVIGRRDTEAEARAVRTRNVGSALGLGCIGYLCIAVGIALAGGLMGDLSAGMLIAFVPYAAFAAFVHELLVGLAAMHSGWFPAFAVALITLLIGVMIGFPMPALTLLVGFSAATGPAFADMGYDLKAGSLSRAGHGAAFEADGRRQQLYAAMAAFVVAIVVVGLTWQGYFAQNLIPPVDRVYATTIRAGIAGSAARSMALWAIPGALMQLIGGQRRQLGVLFATGLLIAAPLAGWAVLVGIGCRQLWLAVRGADGRSIMEVFAGGVIAGDALFSLVSSVGASFSRRR
jgi:uncharacterized oligopeptide transporter (OPT) family protein